jgi:hypothetical protein
LLNFFGTEPTPLEHNIAWAYNDSVYEAADARCHVSFAITPVSKDVRIVLTLDGVTVYELNAVGISDVRCLNEKGRESLEITISAKESIRLRLKPLISISQFCKTYL